ncbi:MAG: substrate-binding domain-containing protein [Alphaproteobacteria bacterium]|nr:substrate-binding domain-containing protein [Alphaproteobacteria bacterium]
MLSLKHRLLGGAALALTAVATSTGALAYASGDVFAGGAALPAPDFRIRLDCYALPTELIIKGTPPQFKQLPPFNYVAGKKSQDCSTKHIINNATIYYVSATSGSGILAEFSHDPTFYGHVDHGDSQYFPSVQFAVSETPLGPTDVGIWDNGGTETQGSQSVTVVAPGQDVGQGQYPSPYEHYGQVVQFPMSVDPLTIAYDPTYEKVLNADSTITSYHFHIKYTRKDDSGGLRLDAPTYCKIFNGQITNWNDPALKALNGNQSLKDPADPTSEGAWSVPLQIVGRSDSAGATAIFTRHLAKVCENLSGNQYADGASTLPAGLRGPTYNVQNPNYPPVSGETLGKFTLAPGMDGVAKYIAFTATPGGSNPDKIILGRVTYLSTDYVLPYVLETGQNSYNLNTATLKNASGKFIAPNAASARASFGSLQPPQSDANGHYDSGNIQNGLRTNPQDWSQPISKTAFIANPTAKKGYPLVGTANFIGYTCYQSADKTKTILGLLKYGDTAAINTDGQKGILAVSGMSPLPKYWYTAIEETFVNNSAGIGININTAGQPGPCSAQGITGG